MPSGMIIHTIENSGIGTRNCKLCLSRQPLPVYIQNTEYFLHPVMVNYSVILYIRRTQKSNNKQSKVIIIMCKMNDTVQYPSNIYM